MFDGVTIRAPFGCEGVLLANVSIELGEARLISEKQRHTQSTRVNGLFFITTPFVSLSCHPGKIRAPTPISWRAD